MAEEQEAYDQIGGGVSEEHESRGRYRVRRLVADHQVVEGVHRPEGRKGASGGVKIVEIGRFENRCIRGRIPAKRRCASAWFQKKNGGRRYFDGSGLKKMAVPRRISNRPI